MKKLSILSIILIVMLSFICMGFTEAAAKGKKYHYNKDLTSINPEFLITPEEAYEWHVFKASLGPTYAGSPGWRSFFEFLEGGIMELGLPIPYRHTFWYDRYFVDDWPESKFWGPKKLFSDGTEVPVASYGMCSGFTPPEGVTAPLIFYDPAAPPAGEDLKGKIVVFKTAPHPVPPYTQSYINSYTVTDHEYRSGPGPYYEMYQYVPPSFNNSFNSRWVWSQNGGYRTIALNNEKAGNKFAGMVVVYDLPWGEAMGLTQRTTEYDCPTLTLDRINGAKVVEDARAGKMATLTLMAEYVPSEVEDFIAFLPGKDYGTEKDEWVGIGCHNDAMSLTQDNGCLGVLGIAKYFSHIPQADRPRSLLLFMDSRHFMPGGESALGEHDLLNIHPELLEPIVATVGLEHMGELEGIQVGDEFMLSGAVEYSYLGVRNDNDILVDLTIKSVKDNNWPRADVKQTDRPGIHGGFQMSVKAPQNFGGRFDITGVGLAGNWCGSHTTTFSGIDRFDENLFVTQVAGMSQIVGELMLVDRKAVDFAWGKLKTMIRKLPDEAFKNLDSASEQRDALFDKFEAVFNQVEAGVCDRAKDKKLNKLTKDMKKKVLQWIVEENQEALINAIDACITVCSG